MEQQALYGQWGSAIVQDDMEAMAALIASGADMNCHDWITGETPLITAVAGMHPDIALQLVRAGADLHAADKQGETPLNHAVRLNLMNLVEAMVEAGADPGFMPKDPKLSYLTPFQSAVQNEHHEMVRFFVEKCGQSIHQRALNGMTMFEMAAYFPSMLATLRSIETMSHIQAAIEVGETRQPVPKKAGVSPL